MLEPRKQLTPIGITEFIDFPDDNIVSVPAKIDTGADFSAIWATNITLEDGLLHFNFFGPESPLYEENKLIQTTTFKTARVKNSFGQVELRYKVKIRVRIGQKVLVRWCNLADRSRNNYPVLLGKNFLKNTFTVDVSQRHIASNTAVSRKVLVLTTAKDPGFMKRVTKDFPNMKITTAQYSDLVYSIDGLNTTICYQSPDKQKDIARYDLVYFRSHNSESELAASAAEYLEFRSRRYVDREVGTYVSMSKLSEYMKLACGGLAVPKTMFASNNYLLAHYDELIEKIGAPFVLKEIASDRGKNNFLINSKADLEKVLNKATVVQRFLAQAYVPNDGFYRMYVMSKDISLIVHNRKTSPHKDPLLAHLNKPSGGLNAYAVPIDDLAADVLQLARRSAELMNRQVAGVDLVQDKYTGAWFLLEVNNAPQLRTGPYTGEKAEILAEFLYKELNR